MFARGYGHDTVSGTIAGQDNVLLKEDNLHLMLEKTQYGLTINIAGTDDELHIQNWSTTANNRMEFMKDSGGNVLFNSQVDQLIQAMSAFSQNTGMSWREAIYERPEDVKLILASYWSPQQTK